MANVPSLRLLIYAPLYVLKYICLSSPVCLPVCLFSCLSLCISNWLWLSIHLYFSMSGWLYVSVNLSVCPSAYACLSVGLHICPPMYVPMYLSIRVISQRCWVDCVWTGINAVLFNRRCTPQLLRKEEEKLNEWFNDRAN